jgi:hypothetical protein
LQQRALPGGEGVSWERTNRNSHRQFRRARERSAAERAGLEVIEVEDRQKWNLMRQLATRAGRRALGLRGRLS